MFAVYNPIDCGVQNKNCVVQEEVIQQVIRLTATELRSLGLCSKPWKYADSDKLPALSRARVSKVSNMEPVNERLLLPFLSFTETRSLHHDNSIFGYKIYTNVFRLGVNMLPTCKMRLYAYSNLFFVTKFFASDLMK